MVRPQTDSTWNVGVVQGLERTSDGTQFRFMPVQIEPPSGCTTFESATGAVATTRRFARRVNNGDGRVSWSDLVHDRGGRPVRADQPAARHPDHDHRRHLRRGSSGRCEHPHDDDDGATTSVAEVQATVTTKPAQSEATAPPTEATTAPTEATTAPTEATTTPTTKSRRRAHDVGHRRRLAETVCRQRARARAQSGGARRW